MSGASPVSDTALLFVVVNVTSLSGCTPQPTPHPSQTAFFPVVHLSWDWDAATDLLDSESLRIGRGIPCSLHMGCPQLALDSGISLKALAQAWRRYQ